MSDASNQERGLRLGEKISAWHMKQAKDRHDQAAKGVATAEDPVQARAYIKEVVKPEAYFAAKDYFDPKLRECDGLPFPPTAIFDIKNVMEGGTAFAPLPESAIKYYKSLLPVEQDKMYQKAMDVVRGDRLVARQMLLVNTMSSGINVDFTKLRGEAAEAWQILSGHISAVGGDPKKAKEQLLEVVKLFKSQGATREDVFRHADDLWRKTEMEKLAADNNDRLKRPNALTKGKYAVLGFKKMLDSAAELLQKNHSVEYAERVIASADHQEVCMDVIDSEEFVNKLGHKARRFVVVDGSGGSLSSSVITDATARYNMIADKAREASEVVLEENVLKQSPAEAVMAAHMKMASKATYRAPDGTELHANAAMLVVDLDIDTGDVNAASVGDCNVLRMGGGQYDRRAWDATSGKGPMQLVFKPQNMAEFRRGLGEINTLQMEADPSSAQATALIGSPEDTAGMQQKIKTLKFNLATGERLLLCTDGAMVNEAVANKTNTVKTAAEKLAEGMKDLTNIDAMLGKFAVEVSSDAVSRGLEDDFGAFAVRWR